MDSALQTMINNMPEKTGKSLDEWTKLLNGKNFQKHSEAMKFLKEDHGVTHGFANTIVALSKKSPESKDLVKSQYTGKENLEKIYNKLITKIKKFGSDVEIAPKKTSVSLRRKRQFALIQPSTKTRIDLGLKFDNRPIKGRLESSGPFGTICKHRVQLTEVSQIDDELINLIKDAYNEAE